MPRDIMRSHGQNFLDVICLEKHMGETWLNMLNREETIFKFQSAPWPSAIVASWGTLMANWQYQIVIQENKYENAVC